jgi:hypothetical protein
MRVKFARIKFVHIDEDFIATELEKNLWGRGGEGKEGEGPLLSI